MRRTKRRSETMCKHDAKGNGKRSRPTKRTEKRSSKRNKRLSASASNRSRPLDGYNAEKSTRDRSRRNKPTSVRGAFVLEKNVSRDERNAAFGMRNFNGSEQSDSFAKWSGLHDDPLWPQVPHQLRPRKWRFSRLSLSLQSRLSSIPTREKENRLAGEAHTDDGLSALRGDTSSEGVRW